METSFSGTARSERHFIALLLPHLLMSNNFAGARALFEKLGLGSEQALNSSDIEIVAELNPIRDVMERVPEKCATPLGKQAQVVPDLFLRIGNSALVIEGKFFTHGSASAVADQLSSQRDAINRVLPYTKYSECSFHYLALTVGSLDDGSDWPADLLRMTWCDVVSVLETVTVADSSEDTAHALEALREAVNRSKREADTASRERGRVTSIQQLLSKANVLSERGDRYVGFVGGEQALAAATVEELETRHHYKYSDCNPNPNWLPLHCIVTHYLKLKADEYAKTNT